MSKQLFKSGTSIGAHVKEAQSPESRADFIHKMKGAYKEAEETALARTFQKFTVLSRSG
jgi:four helix bundle protein